MGAEDTIRILLRVKPNSEGTQHISIDPTLIDGKEVVRFKIEKAEQGLVNNTKEDFAFKFNKVFPPETRQEEVFEAVRPIVDSAIEGFNATIFAYGQTGSGKTFTITGGDKSHDQRGLIPRCMQHIFESLNKQKGIQYEVHCSYLQIYNDTGSDLLNRGKMSNKIEDLPAVQVLESHDSIVLRGLDLHPVPNLKEALNLLLLGDTNRVYCETPMNPVSSRSHCIFTLTIRTWQAGSEKVLRSKLNLVDLAGSERVYKTGVDGVILTEAKHINLSLHHLQRVINALQERADHVPYRDSFMTQVLRDSLGGNCKTVMVATCHGTVQNLDESVSTCRFAQRVASIKQDARINVIVDKDQVIRQLRAEVERLRTRLAAYERGDAPPPEEDENAAAPTNVIVGSDEDKLRITQLEQEVHVRDHHINELKGWLEMQQKMGGQVTAGGVQMQPQQQQNGHTPHPPPPQGSTTALPQIAPARAVMNPQMVAKAATGAGLGIGQAEALEQRAKLFEEFKAAMGSANQTEQRKEVLGPLYAKCKQLGAELQGNVTSINQLKDKIKHLKAERAVDKIERPSQEEVSLEEHMAREKETFKRNAALLSQYKGEIETAEKKMQRSSDQLKENFQKWLQSAEPGLAAASA